MKSVHSGRLERWLGTDKVESLSRQMRGWYGPPIHLLDVPGSVRVCGDGDFVGPFEHGYAASARDSLRDAIRRTRRVRHGRVGAGFANIADVLARLSDSDGVHLVFGKSSVGSVAGAAWTYWNVGGVPAAGAVGGAAPGGTVHVSTDTGAIPYANPSSGTMHLVGADLGSNQTANILLYDRLFSVAKTMNSTATEAVTGVPTRYQSTTGTAADFIGGNFLFPECTTVLPATGHNWTVCTYTNQANGAATLPTITGISSCAVSRCDMQLQTWFAPLAAGDMGVKALTQMQCSALVASGAITFVIGHPIGFMAGPLVNITVPFEWITNRNQAPRIFDNACLAFLGAPNLGAVTIAVGSLDLARADP